MAVWSDLPDELWTAIFVMAIDDSIVLQPYLPTSLAESAWIRSISYITQMRNNAPPSISLSIAPSIPDDQDSRRVAPTQMNSASDWILRSPSLAIEEVLRQGYKFKKSIIKTCQRFRRIGSELLFNYLFIDKESGLRDVAGALQRSVSLLGGDRSFGWWTRRIHLRIHTYAPRSISSISSSSLKHPTMQSSLSALLSYTPNLQVLIIEDTFRKLPQGGFSVPGLSFPDFASTLISVTGVRRSLRTLSLSLGRDLTGKLIGLLSCLGRLEVLELVLRSSDNVPDTDPSQGENEASQLNLGSQSNITLSLPLLQQLSLIGFIEEIVEEAIGWGMPSLQCLTLGRGQGGGLVGVPDIVGFLESPSSSEVDPMTAPPSSTTSNVTNRHKGRKLLYLDLDFSNPPNLPRILDLCPNLTSLVINADWRLETIANPNIPTHNPALSQYASQYGRVTSHYPPMQSISKLVNAPHEKLQIIGLYGLHDGFGIGSKTIGEGNPLQAMIHVRSNDMTIMSITLPDLVGFYSAVPGSTSSAPDATSRTSASLRPANFPALRAVRALSRPLLMRLNEQNGPSSTDGSGFATGLGRNESSLNRFERWSYDFSRVGVRFEDCTGNLMGTLPGDDEVYDDESEEESDEEESQPESDEEDESEEEPLPSQKPENKKWRYSLTKASLARDPRQKARREELRELIKQCQAMEAERDPGLGVFQLAESFGVSIDLPDRRSVSATYKRYSAGGGSGSGVRRSVSGGSYGGGIGGSPGPSFSSVYAGYDPNAGSAGSRSGAGRRDRGRIAAVPDAIDDSDEEEEMMVSRMLS